MNKNTQLKQMGPVSHNIVTILLTILSGIISVLFFFQGQHDNDYLWHIRLGEYFLQKGTLFSEDIFSWVGPEYYLVETAHSWLSSVALALVHSFFQNPITTGAVFCGIFTTLFSYIVGKLFYKEHSPITLLFSIAIGLLCSNPRPQLIGNIFFVLSLYILTESFHQKKYKWIWALPFISILWANFHGGTLPMLFAFEGLFLVLGLFPTIDIGRFRLNRWSETCVINFKDLKNSPKTYLQYAAQMAAVLIASVVTGLLNPYGWKLYIYFFVTNSEATKQFVGEWAPGILKSWYTILLLALLAVPLVFFKKPIRLEKWILPFICLCLGAIHQRILIYGIFAALPLFFDILEQFSFKKKGKPYRLLDMVVAIFGFGSIVSFVILSMPADNDRFAPIPKEITEYVEQSDYNRLFNTYNTGAELIYKGIPVFMDSRGDLYPGEMIEDAYNIETFGFDSVGQMKETLLKYDFDFILLPTTSAATIEYLRTSGEWFPVIEKDGYILFEKIR